MSDAADEKRTIVEVRMPAATLATQPVASEFGPLLDEAGRYHPLELRYGLLRAGLAGSQDIDRLIQRLPDLMKAVDPDVIEWEQARAAGHEPAKASANSGEDETPADDPGEPGVTGRGRRLTAAEKQQIVAASAQGATVLALAGLHNVTPPTIRRVLAQAGNTAGGTDA